MYRATFALFLQSKHLASDIFNNAEELNKIIQGNFSALFTIKGFLFKLHNTLSCLPAIGKLENIMS